MFLLCSYRFQSVDEDEKRRLDKITMVKAQREDIVRQHKAEKWALDGMEYHSEMTKFTGAESVPRKTPQTFA